MGDSTVILATDSSGSYSNGDSNESDSDCDSNESGSDSDSYESDSDSGSGPTTVHKTPVGVFLLYPPNISEFVRPTPAQTRPKVEIRKDLNITDVATGILQMWRKPIEELPIFGDLPRLASRVFIKDLRDEENLVSVPSLLNVYPSENEVTCHTILSVAQILDGPERASNFKEVLDRTKRTAKDGKLWMQEVYEVGTLKFALTPQTAGVNTRTFQLFKTIHQGIIMSLASQIKVIMFANTQAFTKDVRTADGWVISVKIRKTQIRVCHKRKEVSMLSGSSHFEFRWKIAVNLDFELTRVLNITTATKDFRPDPKMDPIFEKKLRDILASMNLQYQAPEDP